jgi:hypothetical protein
MDAFVFVVLVGLGVFSAVVPVVWTILLVVRTNTRSGQPSGGAALTTQAELDQLVARLSRQLGAYSNLPTNKRARQREPSYY